MNRTPYAALAALLLVLAPTARAEFGIGINLGRPTGLNLRVGQTRTIEATAGWDLNDHGTKLELLGNVLYHGKSVLREPPLMGVFPYAGAGLGFWMWDDNHRDEEDKQGVWVQVPLGIDFRFAIPLELTLHIDPGVDVIPSTKATFHWGLGVRYWLN